MNSLDLREFVLKFVIHLFQFYLFVECSRLLISECIISQYLLVIQGVLGKLRRCILIVWFLRV